MSRLELTIREVKIKTVTHSTSTFCRYCVSLLMHPNSDGKGDQYREPFGKDYAQTVFKRSTVE